jgi:carbon-monoxide dehydrogenase large subunit
MSAAGTIAARFGSGQSVRRIEDAALVAGAGRFAADAALPEQAYLCVQRSPYPHARIVAIDTSAALALPGVLAVLSGADLVKAGLKPLASQAVFPAPGGAKAPQTPRRALAVERVRFVGEPVVAVVAETLAAARAARDAVLVDYDDLPAVVHLDDATAPGAP